MTDAPERRRMGNSQGIGGGGVIEFDVLNRFSGDVQFSSEIDCENDASRYVKLGLAVKWALKNGANLDGAKLNMANLNRPTSTGQPRRGQRN